MAGERLTDEQVAAIAADEWATNEDDASFDFDSPALRDAPTLGVEPGGYVLLVDVVMALACEVQQARARRCDNCAHWRRWSNALGLQEKGSCEAHDELDGVYAFVTRSDWFCADFTSKEPVA